MSFQTIKTAIAWALKAERTVIGSFYLFSLAVIILTVLSVQTHERVILPAIALSAYAILLPAYAGKNEHDRRILGLERAKNGHLFVAVWTLAFIYLMFLVGLKPDAQAVESAGYGIAREGGYHLPEYLKWIYLEVCGIWIASKTHKQYLKKREVKKSDKRENE